MIQEKYTKGGKSELTEAMIEIAQTGTYEKRKFLQLDAQ